jgi:LPXTG-motif cell wall-anchored protein
VDRRSIALKISVGGVAAAVASLVMFGGVASAHTAQASVSRECAPSARADSTQATVVITNDFNLAAVVTYSGAASGSSPMVANGSTSVSFTLSAPSTLNYSVVWSDGVTQGQRSISVDPLTDCVITTTTPTTTPTTAPPVTEAPTTVPPAAESIPATTAPEATTTSPTVLGVELQPEAAPVKAAPIPNQLPATGSSDAIPLVAIGAGIVVAGVLLVTVRRVPRSN